MRSMKSRSRHTRTSRRLQLDRRSFLRGSAGLAIGLPFLEGLPERSAWAQGQEPRFALFIGTANGVVQERFWPIEQGTLTDLSTDVNAAGALAGFEQWVTFAQGFTYPRRTTGDTHGETYPQTFTGAPYSGNGADATSSAPSIDVILAPHLNPDGREPLTLFAGMKQSYIGERLSYASAGVLREAQDNPFEVYSDLLQEFSVPGTAAGMDAQLQATLLRRSSAIDFVRDDLQTLLAQSGLSAADRARLELHLESLRELELGLEAPPSGSSCSTQSLDVEAITASAEDYSSVYLTEQIAALQLQLCTFAFACNIHHVATLQSGAGLDKSRYDVPSNERGWDFHYISHRIQSDSAVGDDPLAEAAHAEIDRVRLETFRGGLERFEQHGLLELSAILWANQFTDGPTGSIRNLPIIVAGGAGGTLRTGLHLPSTSGERLNGVLLSTIAHALGVDERIGEGEGMVDELLV